MLVIFIIFLAAILSLFGMMMFRVWEIRNQDVDYSEPGRKIVPEIYFRHIEKIMLYLAKYIIQWVVLVVAKGYFIFITKTRIWASKNLPKLFNFFKKNQETATTPKKYSFFRKAVLELRSKIRYIREKVKREHGGNNL